MFSNKRTSPVLFLLYPVCLFVFFCKTKQMNEVITADILHTPSLFSLAFTATFCLIFSFFLSRLLIYERGY
jgi:hypothetical protein